MLWTCRDSVKTPLGLGPLDVGDYLEPQSGHSGPRASAFGDDYVQGVGGGGVFCALVAEGWRVLRFTWAMLRDHPEAFVAAVLDAIR